MKAALPHLSSISLVGMGTFQLVDSEVAAGSKDQFPPLTLDKEYIHF